MGGRFSSEVVRKTRFLRPTRDMVRNAVKMDVVFLVVEGWVAAGGEVLGRRGSKTPESRGEEDAILGKTCLGRM